MRRAHYQIERVTRTEVVMRDLGPWDQYLTVTNAAEQVVADLIKTGVLQPDQRLFCYDSAGQLDEMLVREGKFAGFAFAPEGAA